MTHSTHSPATVSGSRRTAGRALRLTLVAGAIAAAAAVPAAAQASPRTTAGAAASVSGTEHFQAMTTSATSSSRPVIAYGLFAAGGEDHESSDGSTELFDFAGGSFKMKVVSYTGTQKLDAKSCLFTITRHVKYKLTGGTGKYAGITGSGAAVAQILGVARRSGGKCSLNVNPVTFEQIITASGPVKL